MRGAHVPGLRLGLGLALALAATAGARPARARPAPDPLADVALDARLGAQLPLDARFTGARTGPVALRELFDGRRPVVLVLAYARCRMLCSLVVRGAAEAARRIPHVTGRDYRLVLVGLDPRETPDEAARLQTALLEQLGRPDEPARWPYLVGARASIDAVAGALGFRYAWDARTEQYAHPAALFVLTPEGRLARVLHGVQFSPDELATALDEAAAGRIATAAAAEILRCFRFDPASRRAGAQAERLLRLGAALVFVLLVAGVAGLIGYERRRARSEP